MTNSFFGSTFAKALGLSSVFALGGLTHWGYSVSDQMGASPILFEKHVDARNGQADVVVARPTVMMPVAGLRAKQSAGPSLSHSIGPITPAEARFARSDVDIGAAIGRMANVGPAQSLDLHSLAMVAMQTQQLQTELTLRALQARFERKLRKERARLMALAEQHIDQASRVDAPGASLQVAIAASIVREANRAEAERLSFARKTRTEKDIVVASITSAADVGLTEKSGLGAIAAATNDGKKLPHAEVTKNLAAYAPLPEALTVRVEKRAGPEEAYDLTGVREAIYAYRKGEMDSGDAHAKRANNMVAQVALEWAALSLQPRKAGFERIVAFIDRYPQWPQRGWLQMRAEQSLFLDASVRSKAAKHFEKHEAVSPIGSLAKARVLRARGKKDEAAKVVRSVWREERFNNWLERLVVKEFGDVLSDDDYKYRADLHFYRERYTDSLRNAGKAGKEVYKFAAARVAVARGAAPEKFAGKFSAKYQRDPTWLFAQIRRLRKAEKPHAAAKILIASRLTSENAINGAAWWSEQRMIARRLLDAGDAETAYKVSAAHCAQSGAALLDAEFYAGWIALRFLKKPEIALAHFANSLRHSSMPISRSRAAYWQARAAELGSEPEDANRLYALAAEHSSTYYGQLAHVRLRGAKAVAVRRAPARAFGSVRLMPIRIVELFKQIDEDTMANQLAAGLAKVEDDESQIAALAAIMRREKDAGGSLLIGKLASYRGIELDDIAFPDFGIPKYSPLANSVASSLVYSIARQESAFRAKAVSHAGAKGLMQMLTSTARRTAQRKGIAFDPQRLVSDPAFNAQLGAAHLGELKDEHPGSMILVFAAYNAGGPRVNQWIKAYGDPRKPGVDPIDWVERIPISETRNYVQRVTENLGVYRSMLGNEKVPFPPVEDLRAHASRL